MPKAEVCAGRERTWQRGGLVCTGGADRDEESREGWDQGVEARASALGLPPASDTQSSRHLGLARTDLAQAGERGSGFSQGPSSRRD